MQQDNTEAISLQTELPSNKSDSVAEDEVFQDENCNDTKDKAAPSTPETARRSRKKSRTQSMPSPTTQSERFNWSQSLRSYNKDKDQANRPSSAAAGKEADENTTPSSSKERRSRSRSYDKPWLQERKTSTVGKHV